MKDVSQNSPLKILVLMYSCFFHIYKIDLGNHISFPSLILEGRHKFCESSDDSVTQLRAPISPLPAVSQSGNAEVLWEGIHMVLTCQENEYSQSSIEKLFTHCEVQCSSLICYAMLKTH